MNLLREVENLRNMGLSASCLWAFTEAFRDEKTPTAHAHLGHLMTVLPLVLDNQTLDIIERKRAGLRALVSEDEGFSLAVRTSIGALRSKVVDFVPRTIRAIKCALMWDLIVLADGGFISKKRLPSWDSVPDEARRPIEASFKLGSWARLHNPSEYATILSI